MSQGGDKTEKPTAKKTKELRKKGIVTRSQEMPQATSLLVLVIALPLALKNLTTTYSAMVATALSEAGNADLATAGHLGRSMLIAGFQALAMPVLLVCATIIVTNLAITREKPNVKLMKPRFEALSPKAGIKRVFSAHGMVEFAKTAVKLALMGALGYLAFHRGITHLVNSRAPLGSVISTTLSTTKTLLVQVAAVALFIGFVDLAWSIRRYGKQAKMSKQEVRDESKQQEVNPEVKGAIRQKQLKMSRLRMISAVGGSDVVLTNPTHLAVALKYDTGSFAPKVVAKGAGLVAQRIREKAVEADVPVLRNVPLARALHNSCQIGDSIPIELFRAVAEVLATVYATKHRRGGRFPQVKVSQAAESPAVPAPRSDEQAPSGAGSADRPTL
jgi:flagellar biosynthetic protein FlhB